MKYFLYNHDGNVPALKPHRDAVRILRNGRAAWFVDFSEDSLEVFIRSNGPLTVKLDNDGAYVMKARIYHPALSLLETSCLFGDRSSIAFSFRLANVKWLKQSEWNILADYFVFGG